MADLHPEAGREAPGRIGGLPDFVWSVVVPVGSTLTWLFVIASLSHRLGALSTLVMAMFGGYATSAVLVSVVAFRQRVAMRREMDGPEDGPIG